MLNLYDLSIISIKINSTILLWWPWLNFSFDFFLLQFLLLYTLFLFITINSLFYTLFYLFLEIIYFGVFLSYYQLEIFTAFLWLAESVVIFVSLMLLFYTTVYDNNSQLNLNILNKKTLIIIVGFFYLILHTMIISETEYFLPIELHINLFWDDFYEALNNDKLNDLFGSMLSFYLFNSFEFLVIGLLLLVGSIICVNLNRFLKSNRVYNYPKLFNLFDIFKNSIKTLFMRKQNLVNQESQVSSTKMFKKK